jgi:hypothetical protein
LRAKRGVKVTAWRTINSLVLLTFGATKAVMVSRGNPVADSFDMAVGLVWALMYATLTLPVLWTTVNGYSHTSQWKYRSFWCGILEEENPRVASWLFEADITEFVFSVLALLAVWAASGLAFILLELGEFHSLWLGITADLRLILLPNTLENSGS